MKAKCFRAGEQVFSSGEVPAHIYILNRGRANLTREHSRKMSALTRPVEPDQMFGVIEVLADHHFEPCLVAATPCDFQVIERADFVAFLEVRPDVCFTLATVISSLYRDAVTRLKTG